MGDRVHSVDKRSGSQIAEFTAHEDLCLAIAYNPNKLHTLASVGADSMTRIWDMRKPGSCLL